MNEAIIKRLGNLLSVKALVTLALTAVFAVMAAQQAISQDFMTIYAVIIAFYFGTQSQKTQDAIDGGNGRAWGRRAERLKDRRRGDREHGAALQLQPDEVRRVVWTGRESLVHDVRAVVLRPGWPDAALPDGQLF